MKLYGIFPRNEVAENKKVLIAEKDIKGRSIADTFDELIEQSGKVVLEVDNITELNDTQCNDLKCGDQVVKRTGNQKHSYIVSYKEDKVGLCLTYIDASVSETVSYDYTGNHWVYNSTDITPLDSDGMTNPMTTSQDIIIGGSSGTPTRLAKGSNGYLLGVDGSGNLAYGNSLPIITTAPSSANTDGGVKIVVLTSEPLQKFEGFLYIITSSN